MRQGKRPRLAYLSGPVDAAAVYDTWINGSQHNYFGTSYLSQFYQLCTELDAEAYVVTTLPGQYLRRQLGNVLIENRPEPLMWRGLFYHIAVVCWYLRLMPGLIRFKPKVLIVTALQNYWFLLIFLNWWGIKILPSLHSMLWPKFMTLRLSWRVLLRLNAIFYAKYASAIMAVSNDIAEQVRNLTGDNKRRVSVFLSTYPKNQFSSIRPANFNVNPFRIMFAGRIVSNKGIYDLLQIAYRLQLSETRPFHIDICGEGPELEPLRQRIKSLNITETISCHGFCAQEKLSSFFDKAHVIIVPSTSQCEEGFAKICVEAILAERPVVTSAVCPALASIREAAIEVPPDNVEAYFRAIMALSNDRKLYERKRLACKPLQTQFYDLNNSWGARLRQLYNEILVAQSD
jgi:glycogen synthase